MRLPAAGEVFQGKYDLHRVIGKGGFATVFLAKDREVGREVALKILSPKDGKYPEAVVARFMREARLLAGLADPHTITMFDFGSTDDGLLFMVFEYVSGLDLGEHLKRRGALEPAEVESILKQVLMALREAHDAGVFHRDIKPANVLMYEYMGNPNCVKLLDFGVAKPAEAHPMGIENLTRKGALVGTPRYMAPEQIYGKDLTPSADLYSLGLVAYELLTGSAAMDGKTNKERVRQQLSNKKVVVPTSHGTPKLRSVINRMIEKDPRARFQSASEALGVLRGQTALSTSERGALVGSDEESDDTVAEGFMASPVAKQNLRRIGVYGLVTVSVGLLGIVGLRSTATQDEPAEVVELGSAAPKPGTPAARPDVRSPAPQAPTKATTEPVTAPQTSGCERRDVATGLQTHSSMIGLNARKYYVYVPSSYAERAPLPVVLMYHQTYGEPVQFMEETQVAELADKHGFLPVAPTSSKTKSAGDRAWEATDNFEFTAAVLDDVRTQYCTDPERTFAIGHGRGSWFARDLACYHPLSAIALSGGGVYRGEEQHTCRTDPATPTLRIYGADDKIIPEGGGSGCWGPRFEYASASEINNAWVNKYHCDPKPVVWMKHSAGTCQTWGCAGGQARFVSCRVDGGHDWPGFMVPPIANIVQCNSRPAQFPFMDTIWRFFEQEGRLLVK